MCRCHAWRWDDVNLNMCGKSPLFRRILRSDALGKSQNEVGQISDLPIWCAMWLDLELCTVFNIPFVPARGGAEVVSGMYFQIYRTCMRRAPARPVRACYARPWCVVPQVALQTPHFKLHSSHLPELLCTKKLAQSTSQYYFVWQSLHKVQNSTNYF